MRALIHPQLAHQLRGLLRAVWARSMPDDETLILGDGPACRGESCCQGRQQCRTPGACYAPARHEKTPPASSDAAHAVLLVACTAILAIWGASALAGLTWADALRVLASLSGA